MLYYNACTIIFLRPKRGEINVQQLNELPVTAINYNELLETAVRTTVVAPECVAAQNCFTPLRVWFKSSARNSSQ